MRILEALLAETFGVPVDDPKVQGVLLELERRRRVDRRILVRETRERRCQGAVNDSDAFQDDLYLMEGGELTLEQLHEKWSGRPLYLRTRRKRDMTEVKEAIRRDPCRDYKVVSRRYRVSVAVVYRVWNEKAS
jgi:hypothetical protein